MARVLIKDLQEEIRKMKEAGRMSNIDIVELSDINRANEEKIKTLDSQLLQSLADRTRVRLDLISANKEIDRIKENWQMDADTLTSVAEELAEASDENTRLINKNEAMQSIMDSMAHLATAGQALIEL